MVEEKKSHNTNLDSHGERIYIKPFPIRTIRKARKEKLDYDNLKLLNYHETASGTNRMAYEVEIDFILKKKRKNEIYIVNDHMKWETLEENEVNQLKAKLEDIQLSYWDTEDNNLIIDGTSWGFELEFKSGEIFKLHGSNHRPEKLHILINVLDKIFDKLYQNMDAE